MSCWQTPSGCSAGPVLTARLRPQEVGAVTWERMAKSPDPDATALLLGDLSQALGACQSLAFPTGKRGLRCPLDKRLNTGARDRGMASTCPACPLPSLLTPHGS